MISAIPPARPGMNTVPMLRLDSVTKTFGAIRAAGPILRFQLAIEGGQSVALEGHMERYGQGFAAGSPVRVTWDPSRATIIPATA